MFNTQDYIRDYLHFGYVPLNGNTTPIFQILEMGKNGAYIDELKKLSEEDLISKGISILNKVFDEAVLNKENSKHLIPLSGGLDSRVIFNALLERVNPQNIYTRTFGSPGSFDFYIPKLVVKETGVNFEQIDCTKLDYNIENLVSAVKDGGAWTSVPDNYINRLALKFDGEVVRWSGFIGDFVAGSYSTKNSDSDNNFTSYIEKEKRSKSLSLTANQLPGNDRINMKISPILNLTEYELIALRNRIPASTVPILYSDSQMIISPLIHPEWVRFMFSLPLKYRKNSLLFKKIVVRMYPNSFKIPCKNNLGLALNNNKVTSKVINKIKLKIRHEFTKIVRNYNYPPYGVNYLHYPEAIRKLPSLNKSISEACVGLDDRGILSGQSALSILNEHLKRDQDHSEALLILLGLEVNLRAFN